MFFYSKTFSKPASDHINQEVAYYLCHLKKSVYSAIHNVYTIKILFKIKTADISVIYLRSWY